MQISKWGLVVLTVAGLSFQPADLSAAARRRAPARPAARAPARAPARPAATPARPAAARPATTTTAPAAPAIDIVPASAVPTVITIPVEDTATAAASRFVAYLNEADRALVLPTSAAQIQSGVTRSATINAGDMPTAVLAYGALAASRDPAFIAEVQRAATQYGAAQLVESITRTPDAIANLPSSATAAQAAQSAISAGLARIDAAIENTRSLSYSLQRQQWASVRIDPSNASRALRVATAAPLPQTPIPAGALGTSAGVVNVGSTGPLAGTLANGTPIYISNKVLAAAALLILGDDVGARALVQAGDGGFCMRRQRLNVSMCVSVGGQPFEQLFCQSRHAFTETRACMVEQLKAPTGANAPMQATLPPANSTGAVSNGKP